MSLGLQFFHEKTIVNIEKLGRYDIVRVLGKGAMGVVYEGRDPNLDRRVAIKTIRVQNLSKEAALEYEGRFRTEARSAARLHHANIVSVFDSGQDGDTAFLVMEFIQGDDLKHHLEHGVRFSVRAAVTVVYDLLMALDHAHRQNVVHRDVKPANILIEASGRIKLADFGVARIQEPDEANLTQLGTGVGTPKYMSPEQAKGARVDSRSDVFSAGVVLYELLTGVQPFTGDNQFVVINQIVTHTPPPPSALNPEVPAALDEVMADALAKNPDDRFGSAREFALALRLAAQQISAGAGAGAGQSDVVAALGRRSLGAAQGAAAGADLRDGSSTGTLGLGNYGSQDTTLNPEVELEYWKDVKDSLDRQDFLAFLEKFPGGIYAPRARRRLERMTGGDTQGHGATDPAAATDPVPRENAAAGAQAALASQAADTVPGTAAVAPAEGVAPAAADTSVQPKSTGVPKTWMMVAAGLGLGVVAAGLFLSRGDEPRVGPAALPADAASLSAAAEPPASMASAQAAVAQAAVAASGAASSPLASASRASRQGPAAAASRAVPPRPTAVTASASAPENAPAPTAAVPAAAKTAGDPVEPAKPAIKATAAGPSAPGQVCADRVFLARISCIAEQCQTDLFARTEECATFKEMENRRQQQRSQ